MKTKEIKEWLVDSNVSKAWGSDTKSPPIDLGTAIELGCHVKIVHKLYYLDLPGLLRYLQVVILHGGKLRSTSKNQNNMVFNDVMKTSTLMLQQPIFVHAGQSHLGPLGHVIALMRTSNHLWCHVIWRANHGGRLSLARELGEDGSDICKNLNWKWVHVGDHAHIMSFETSTVDFPCDSEVAQLRVAHIVQQHLIGGFQAIPHMIGFGSHHPK